MQKTPTNSLPNPQFDRNKEARVDRFWTWRNYKICYRAAGLERVSDAPAVVLIHGFGASVGHWHKNMPALAGVSRVFAIDLIGFGASEKPHPSQSPYTFETWGMQVADFVREVVGSPAILIGNSIGAVVAMQTAILAPELVTKTILINCSLRLLQEQKQITLPWSRRVGAKVMQNILGNRAIAKFFFDLVRRPQTVRKILKQAYVRDEAVTDELVEMLVKPAQDPNAVAVFMAFVRYSQGPTPEELLEKLPCSAIVLWGEKDPWEPIELGREFTKFACVSDFIPIANAGHCPQDEAPELVNPILIAAIQN
ncbi:alpha/beta fold hydrolase [Tumidithrix elongata RA019]|uniref:Alpha/beta fold hydrolase n=1 Tax=Tumidithrix elongata BACA0141 TaxID=2716417 RepID=A0AAW9Q7M4_9CYAN|nr:alpha/beta fold hydrolase [Tumidithrix elongata RA019]